MTTFIKTGSVPQIHQTTTNMQHTYFDDHKTVIICQHEKYTLRYEQKIQTVQNNKVLGKGEEVSSSFIRRFICVYPAVKIQNISGSEQCLQQQRNLNRKKQALSMGHVRLMHWASRYNF